MEIGSSPGEWDFVNIDDGWRSKRSYRLQGAPLPVDVYIRAPETGIDKKQEGLLSEIVKNFPALWNDAGTLLFAYLEETEPTLGGESRLKRLVIYVDEIEEGEEGTWSLEYTFVASPEIPYLVEFEELTAVDADGLY